LSYDPATNTLVIAVADGVSNAPDSHVGATAATKQAVDCAMRQLQGTGHCDLQEVAENAANALLEMARRLAGREVSPHEAEERCACTLSVAIVRPGQGKLLVEAITIGDSAIAVLDGESVRRLVGAYHTCRRRCL
jgi:hypothetical protein